ncbi:MAG: phosphate ABC transporter ATP-binding protein [Elusimicrobia bacterium]|nr:phosphate ABC transporter ATP-binding protein [Elusimicrobiota bacterium]MBU2614123.1 phosphate ABC transporter ATP-binding protein [Elusimicrobiota bacterium]
MVITVNNFSAWFGKNQVIKSLNMEVYSNEILGIIGPANSGKTTFLKTLNRLNDLDDDFKMDGKIFLDNRNIYEYFDVISLRKKVSIIFAMPLPLPISIFDNVAYGPKMHGIKKGLDEIVERSLRAAYIWEEVKDRLHESALNLSGGQQQRLCIARSLAVEPEVVLFDEPCSGLDPISTAKVEEAMMELKKKYTIILVTNNVKQAARVSDRVAFFMMGELIEIDSAEKMYTNSVNKKTIDYISGRFG